MVQDSEHFPQPALHQMTYKLEAIEHFQQSALQQMTYKLEILNIFHNRLYNT